MKKILLKLYLIVLIAVTACLLVRCKPTPVVKPTTSTQYTMQFNLTASGTPLAGDQVVTNSGNTRYYIDLLRFYMGYPRLVKTDGTEVPLSNLCIVALDKQTPFNSIFSNSFTFTVPSGDYKAVRFGVGVPPAIKDTVTHYHNNEPFNPMNDNYGMLWSGFVNVFRDIALQIQVDTSKNQNMQPAKPLIIHVLEDGDSLKLNLYKDLEFDKTFSIGNGTTVIDNFNIDANQVFFPAGNIIDIRNAGSTDMFYNDKTGIGLGTKLLNNFAKAISKQ